MEATQKGGAEKETALRQLQRRFRKVLKEESSVEPGDAAWLRNIPPVDLETRVGIYQYAYWARILESLEEDFPRALKILGQKTFRSLGRAFLNEHPPRYSHLAEVSRDFPAFVGRSKEGGFWPFLESLMQLEWAETISFLTEDPAALSMEMPADADMNGVAFRMHPSLILLESEYPVHALKRKDEKKRKTFLMICRQRGRVRTTALNSQQWMVMQQLEKGTMLGQLYPLCTEVEISEKTLSKWFSEWTRDGVIIGIRKIGGDS